MSARGGGFVDLLALLGHGPDDAVVVCHKRPGAAFVPTWTSADKAPDVADDHADSDVWFSVNALPHKGSGRGEGVDVTRLAALYADLDVKVGGMPDMAAAVAVVRTVSDMLGAKPAAVVETGHGLQPYWPLEADDPAAAVTDATRGDAVALLRRFGRLVAHVASLHGGRVDSVFDLARVLRVPGTVNRKHDAVPTRLSVTGSRALSVAEVNEQLTTYNAVEQPGDRDQLGTVVAPAADWPWAAATHPAVTRAVASWGRRGGLGASGRHPWLLGCATSLAIARRLGMVTEVDHAAALVVLQERFGWLLAHHGEPRHPSPGEVADCFTHGVAVAERKSEADAFADWSYWTRDTDPAADRVDPDWPQDADVPGDAVVEAELDAAYTFARDVEDEARRIRVREAARVKVAGEAAPEVPPFDAGLLEEVLARPAEPPYRVDGLIPAQGAALIAAQRKTGKTTLDLNLARSLLTGEDFLGRFPVRPIDGRVAFLNYEVSAGQLARWADETGVDRRRLYLVNLRGRRNPFGNDEDRALLAERLRHQEVESLMVDPFGRAYTGKSQNDPGEVGAWLADLDRWARTDAGAVDVVLSAHAGWNGERTRGASALEDWADVVVTMTRRNDPDADDDGSRWLRAEGRDVLVEEDRLDYDPGTRTLSLTGTGSRKVASNARRVEALLPAVVQVVTAEPGLTGYGLEKPLRAAGATFTRGHEVKAAALAVERGLLRIEPGRKRGAKHYHPPTYPDLPRPTPAGEVLTYPDLPLVVGGGQQGGSSTDLPRTADCPDCGRPLAGPPSPACSCRAEHDGVGARQREIPGAAGAAESGTPSPAALDAVCQVCGRPLLLQLPGRTTCARCAPEGSP